MKSACTAIGLALTVYVAPSFSQGTAEEDYSYSMTYKYSQKELLKNWALSVCLAAVAKDPRDKDDANATASAYLEFGRQKIEAYDALRTLALQYANRKYGGSVKADFNTMKCIDLFHSKDLDRLANRLAGQRLAR